MIRTTSNKRRKKCSGLDSETGVNCTFELDTAERINFFSSLTALYFPLLQFWNNNFFAVCQDLYSTQSLCDIQFLVDGLSYGAHRMVLVASGGYLGALVKSGMKESGLSTIEIKDDPILFKLCLDFLYGVPIDVESSQVRNTFYKRCIVLWYSLDRSYRC